MNQSSKLWSFFCNLWKKHFIVTICKTCSYTYMPSMKLLSAVFFELWNNSPSSSLMHISIIILLIYASTVNLFHPMHWHISIICIILLCMLYIQCHIYIFIIMHILKKVYLATFYLFGLYTNKKIGRWL